MSGRPEQSRLTIRPVTFREACEFVQELHRHHKPPRGHKFSISVWDEEGCMRGVAMIGRPVARSYDTGLVAEVNRTCTDGCPNANSALYGASWRVCKAMGYLTLLTYTQAGESGSSLRGAGWRYVKTLPARGSWVESSADVRLRSMRDQLGNGWCDRYLWIAGRDLVIKNAPRLI